MKRFSCGDVVPGCKARFQGETEVEVLQQVAQHATADHGMTAIPDSLVAEVRSKIKDDAN